MPFPENLDWVPIKSDFDSGGQGTIHLVHRKGDTQKTPHVLKLLKKPDSEKAHERFLREIETVRNIRHPAIIEVVDFSDQDSEPLFLVTKYHEGAKTIENICLSGDHPNPFHGDAVRCLCLFKQLISAIQACESQDDPIFHRDISPKNVLVLPDDSIRLIDFGLCQTDGDATITLTGESLGTRYYAPPECLPDSRFKIGTHTDIYSASKVLWSTITSQRAFSYDDDVLDRKSMQTMFPESESLWHLDRIFKNIVRSDPDERIQTTAQVIRLVSEVRHAAINDFPPLELIADRCPSCKRTTIHTPTTGHILFGGRRGGEYTAHECTTCGFTFARLHKTLKDNIKNLYPQAT